MMTYGYPGNIRRVTAAGKTCNVAFAAYVTTQARLELYEYVSDFGVCSLLWNNVIFIQNVDNAPKVGTGD